MSSIEKVNDMLTKIGNDYDKLADRAWKSGDQDLIMYLMKIGFAKISANMRRKSRQMIKENVIRKEFLSEDDIPKIKIKLTNDFRSKHIQRTISNIMSDWKIGGVELGKCTKEKLLKQAQSERSAGRGHIENAILYERLAAPMNNKETVSSYWKDSRAIVLIRDEILTNIAAGSNSVKVPLLENRTEP